MAPTAEARFTRIYEAHHDDVLAYCARRVNRAEADDVACDVFVVLWRKIEEVHDETARAWLFAVAHNTIVNRWRGAARNSRFRLRLARAANPQPESTEEIVVRREQDREILAAVAKLRAADQEVLRLAAWEELSPSEIAIVIGCSVSAAEQRLHRAKKRLSKALPSSLSLAIASGSRSAWKGGRS